MWVQSLSLEDAMERAWQPIPSSLPEESHGQKSLAGCRPQGPTELEKTEATYHA